jgi:hypothetical protein
MRQQHERHRVGLIRHLEHPVLSGLNRILAQAVDEACGVPILGGEAREIFTAAVPHQILRRTKDKNASQSPLFSAILAKNFDPYAEN